MTPNRVMLSEARSTEVKQLVECWTTGITGFTTLHTDDVRKIPDRILNMMPSRQDAERLENDVYVGMDVGVLLETRSSGEEGKQERYISQIGFFSREDGKNRCVLAVQGGQLIEQQESEFLPEDIKRKMDKAGITDVFYCEQLQKMLEEEGICLLYTSPSPRDRG